MQWCCPDKEIDEAYGEEYRRAVYLNSVGRTPGDTQLPLKSLEELPTHNNSYKQLPPENTRLSRSPQHSLELAKTRNVNLGRDLERRKITLWTHANQLVERSDMLRQTYIQRNNELQLLCREIDRHFA